jgi:general secretion pathway protein G
MVRVLTHREDRRRQAFTLLEVLIVVAIIVILVGLGGTYAFRSFEDAKKNAARITASDLGAAAQRYQLQYGSLPDQLAVLAQPPEGTPFIEARILNDPWGNAFRYDPSGPRNGGLKPDIWAVAPDGTECGNWPAR